MQALDRALRRELERTIQQARETAEAATRASLEQLGVGNAKSADYLNDAQRDLRRRLRGHGRQLGDERHASGAQDLERLTEEIAYEHWHRMLFARFLAENNLLMYPDPQHPVPVTLAECADLAESEGLRNGWEVAARYAGKMLPQIFRADSPVFELTLPPEYQRALESLLANLHPDTFHAQDSLGWVYQFWQAKRKDQVNESEVKIGARELPAVTQLFTEPYMVSFLLDNMLGAWWANQRLSADDWQNAPDEATLRQKAAIDGVPLTYLRLVRDETSGAWTPAAGTFSALPASLADWKVLDPCCGSGHFLVAALLMLTPLRQTLEKLTPQQALDAVLRENLHGLELDPRCVEIAAFALALEAWRYPSAGGYRPLPELQLACAGLDIRAAQAEWKTLALGKKNLEFGLKRLYELFKDAPTLGSLLNPTRLENMIVQWADLQAGFEQAMQAEQDQERRAAGVVAQGMTKAASLLTGQYHWVITNVPYLARGKQSETLRDFLETYHPEGKADLATAFLERCLDFCAVNGVSSVVLPQNWLFLGSYQAFRKKRLLNDRWHLIGRLGAGAFQTISGEVVNAILITLSRGDGAVQGGLFAPSTPQILRGVDVSAPRTADEKAALLRSANVQSVLQSAQLQNPDARIVFDEQSKHPLFEQIASAYIGLHVGGWDAYRRGFWELPKLNQDWVFVQGSVNGNDFYSGLSDISFWIDGGSIHENNPRARVQGRQAWNKKGVITSPMNTLPFGLYMGGIFDNNTCTIIPKHSEHLAAIWCFCSSPEYNEAVRKIDQKLNVTNATLVKVPFELERWQKVAAEKYPHGLPAPYSDDPTQWLFHGHPCGSVVWDETAKQLAHGQLRTDATVLQVAVARLLGYRFPAELDPTLELSAESRAWVAEAQKLAPFADRDGIVCLPAVGGERPAAERLLALLVAAYENTPLTPAPSPTATRGEGSIGGAWLHQLLASADASGKTLEFWLREKFFSQHCALFGQRPFIWHIWDGLRDGFGVLVNYHRLSDKGLEALIYTYLGDWISRQKQDVAQGVDGAQEKLSAAEGLKKRLEQIRQGEAPYDIFVRWKPLAEQPLGWQPDLNDGVRLNIRPFMSVADVGKKGAGILRDKPNIDWKKDRGSDVETAPWYTLGKQYGGKFGDRINEHHLSLAEKLAARAKKGEA